MTNVAEKLDALKRFEMWTQEATDLSAELASPDCDDWNKCLKEFEDAKLKVEEARAELYKHLEIV